MYEAADDPDCYPGTTVLRNLLGLRTQAELTAFEVAITTQRAREPAPAGKFDADHYRGIHRRLFQDVYAWAGEFRTIRITRGASTFCYPENIEREIGRVFGELIRDNFLRGLDAKVFAIKAAHFLTDLNAIHPFREGNGRVQNIFLLLLAERAGHPLDFDRLEPGKMLAAMVASFHGDEAPLAALILSLTHMS